MKAAIIGAGNMGSAIARGMAKGSIVPATSITVSNPSQGKLDRLKAAFPALQVTRDNRAAAKGADMVILAVKPWLIEPVVKELGIEADTLVVSVAAGISCGQLAGYTGNLGQPVFRLIPNTAISEMQSMTLITGNNTTDEQRKLMLDIFCEMGMALWLPELGIYPKDGMRMVAQSLKGAAELILNNDTHPSIEIDKVCTPGGITIKGINELEHEGFTSTVIKAIKASK